MPPSLLLLHVLTRLPVFSSSLLGTMFTTPQVIYEMAEDGLLFKGLSWSPTHSRTHIMAIMASGNLAGG